MSVEAVSSGTFQTYTNSTGVVDNKSLNDPQLMIKMLAISMQNQDPLNPTDSNEFMGQMTQYATIEALSSVQDSVANMTKVMEQISSLALSTNLYMVLNNSQALVGKEVDMLVPKGTNGSTEDEIVTGIVEKVELTDDGIFLTINGEKHEYNNIKTIYG